MGLIRKFGESTVPAIIECVRTHSETNTTEIYLEHFFKEDFLFEVHKNDPDTPDSKVTWEIVREEESLQRDCRVYLNLPPGIYKVCLELKSFGPEKLYELLPQNPAERLIYKTLIDRVKTIANPKMDNTQRYGLDFEIVEE